MRVLEASHSTATGHGRFLGYLRVPEVCGTCPDVSWDRIFTKHFRMFLWILGMLTGFTDILGTCATHFPNISGQFAGRPKLLWDLSGIVPSDETS